MRELLRAGGRLSNGLPSFQAPVVSSLCPSKALSLRAAPDSLARHHMRHLP
jgi:hypothetical protein